MKKQPKAAKPDNTRAFFGCRVTQRGDSNIVPFFVFYTPVRDLLRWAGVRSVAQSRSGTQRMLRPTKVKAIERFMNAFPQNSIPNSILVAMPEGATHFQSLHKKLGQAFPDVLTAVNCCGQRLQWGVLSLNFRSDLPSPRRPIQIVDGQHRAHGMAALDEDPPVLVVALLDAPQQEQAFQFIVINNKATRVPTDNVKAIIEGVKENELLDRLLASGVPYGSHTPVLRDVDTLASSPFRGLLDWPANRTGTRLVPLTAIEQSLRYLESVMPFLSDDDDTRLQVFLAMWDAVKCAFATLWGKDNVFMTKVNINALNEFLSDKMKSAWEFERIDIFDTKSVREEAAAQVAKLAPEFWDAGWNVKVQDNANVRSMIKGDLEQMIMNNRLDKPWHDDLRIAAAIAE